MNRGVALGALACAFLFAAVPTGSAQYTFSASGVAIAGDVVLKAFLSRHPDPDFTTLYTMVLSQRVPTPTDPFAEEVLEITRFDVTDNFNLAPDATATQYPFEAWSIDPNVTFDLSGIQVSRTITGRGHYQQYELIVTAELFGL